MTEQDERGRFDDAIAEMKRANDLAQFATNGHKITEGEYRAALSTTIKAFNSLATKANRDNSLLTDEELAQKFAREEKAREIGRNRARSQLLPQEPSSWVAADLEPYLSGSFQAPTTSVGMARMDGLSLLYPGKEHSIIGEMESGKTWVCVASAAQVLMRHPTRDEWTIETTEDDVQRMRDEGVPEKWLPRVGRHRSTLQFYSSRDLRDGAASRERECRVVYIHFEESEPASTVERLLLLGVTADAIRDRFRFVGATSPLRDGDLDAFLEFEPALVILDGVNEGMALHGWGIREEDGAAAFRRALVKPWTRPRREESEVPWVEQFEDRPGAAVLSCDHVVKDPNGRGRYALGSIHKGNAIDGALFLVENVEPFGRGRVGRSRLYAVKDRPGHLRQHGRSDAKMPGKTLLGDVVLDDQRLLEDRPMFAWTEPAPETTPGSPPRHEAMLAALRADTAATAGSSIRSLLALLREHEFSGDDKALTVVAKAFLAECAQGDRAVTDK